MADNPLVYRLSNALALAKTAVEADNNSDYTSACWRYKELVVMLEADLPNFPSEIRPALAERIAVYRARAVSLESVLHQKSNRPFSISSGAGLASRSIGTLMRRDTTKVAFSEEPIHPATAKMMEAPPVSNLARPFWLIKVLNTTITVGGFLTPKLYIPPMVWKQQGARFQAVQYKIGGLQTLLEALSKLSLTDTSDKDLVIKQLEELCPILDSVQNGLARHISFIKSNQSPSLLKGVARGASLFKTGLTGGHTDGSYVQLLSQTFQKAACFEAWILQWEKGAKEVVELLKKVSDFFYNVILAFAIR